ncbi:MAG TPA: exonuclease SbcCD subunit D [Ktedonobacterales bacterium]
MRATFIHTADNHLGYEQYGVKERFNDFARAFFAIVDDAIARKVDFFICAGDLFHKRASDVLTLMQAEQGLRRLREAGIPVIAVEGNHDRTYYKDGASWLQYLCWQGLLTLLDPVIEAGEPQLSPWNPDSMQGSYVDLLGGKVRVYGLPWYGAGTVRVMQGMARALKAARDAAAEPGVEFRILVMHTGVEGIVPQLHGLPNREDFEPLHSLVDYVALGHVHKQYEMDHWLYNPGSTETVGAEESAWERGFYAVTVDDGTGAPQHQAKLVINARRPFLRLAFNVDGLTSPGVFRDAFERFCQEEARRHAATLAAQPVVEVALLGTLAFEASAIERAALEERVTELFQPLIARVVDRTRDSGGLGMDDDDENGRDRSTWQQRELKVFAEMLNSDARFAPHAGAWAHLAAEVKSMAVSGEPPEHIVARLRETRAKLAKGDTPTRED